jgi:hypothetical protein
MWKSARDRRPSRQIIASHPRILCMKRVPIIAGTILCFWVCDAQAIQSDGTYQTTEPTDEQVYGWSSGWENSLGLTGWDYVGSLNGASGVYLGNGWVMTAAHVGAGTFTLQGTAYSMVAGSVKSIFDTDSRYSADLILFRINNAPDRPALTIAPIVYITEPVIMLGYGGAGVETWGENAVGPELHTITPSGYTYKTVDFAASYSDGPGRVVGSDSGGGDFVQHNGLWYLAGINEAKDSNNSYLVYLPNYLPQIQDILAEAVPEPSTWALGLAGGGLLLAFVRQRNAGSGCGQ